MKLAYDVAGDGPALVIIHGLFGSKTNWRSIVRALENEFKCFTVDLRNHGESPHSAEMTYAAMAEDLHEFIDDHCEGRAFVAGHSMGGKAAMTLALTHPSSVERLAVVDVAPVHYPTTGEFKGFIDAMQAMDLDMKSRREADQQLARSIEQPAIRAFLLQNLRQEGDQWRWRINLAALQANMENIRDFGGTGQFDGPTLFLRGGTSSYVTDDMLPECKNLFPQMSLTTVDGAGHWVHAQAPQQVTDAFRSLFTP